jgi:hypothetical protein
VRGNTSDGAQSLLRQLSPSAPKGRKLERYPVRVMLCAYMIQAHPEVVFNKVVSWQAGGGRGRCVDGACICVYEWTAAAWLACSWVVDSMQTDAIAHAALGAATCGTVAGLAMCVHGHAATVQHQLPHKCTAFARLC